MSRAGSRYLRDVYAEAWEIRTTTGDPSPDVLLAAWRRRERPEDLRDLDDPGRVVLDLWRRGVPPSRLQASIHLAIPGLIWRSVVVPVQAIWDVMDTKSGPGR